MDTYTETFLSLPRFFSALEIHKLLGRPFHSGSTLFPPQVYDQVL